MKLRGAVAVAEDAVPYGAAAAADEEDGRMQVTADGHRLLWRLARPYSSARIV